MSLALGSCLYGAGVLTIQNMSSEMEILDTSVKVLYETIKPSRE